jgi:hypothetical protein
VKDADFRASLFAILFCLVEWLKETGNFRDPALNIHGGSENVAYTFENDTKIIWIFFLTVQSTFEDFINFSKENFSSKNHQFEKFKFLPAPQLSTYVSINQHVRLICDHLIYFPLDIPDVWLSLNGSLRNLLLFQRNVSNAAVLGTVHFRCFRNEKIMKLHIFNQNGLCRWSKHVLKCLVSTQTFFTYF